ncbi:ABC transporter substrate-binding protein [Acuticoccus kandeliae]|uniref:ABC transporter substrate-binding protein n=1 Tax=Acuticoccus kandeliae TaxID=2073160 RepID=UPI000D3EAAFA|nr:ABC transporter substrate-binding protein [Acuticoccus kandeliae]
MTARRIGILMAEDTSYPAYSAFRDELDLQHKQTVLVVETIERFAGGRHELLPSLAAELASARPDLIVAIGAVSFYAVHAIVGDTVPIVFAIVVDPYAAGLISEESQRDGNVAGVTSFNVEQTGEQIRILKDTIDEIATLALIGDANVPPILAEMAKTAALAQGFRPVVRLLRSFDDIASAMSDFRAEGATALLGLEVPRINTHCLAVAEAATATKLPTVFGWDMARAAPLIAYGTSFSKATRRAAGLAVRILQGEDTRSSPVEYETSMNLTVNLATARRLGVDVPQSILEAANHVDA